MTRVVLVGPGPGTRGGISHFNSHLAMALAPHADVSILAFRRLYPAWSGPGRNEVEPAPLDPAVPTDRLLLAWRPYTWRAASRRLRQLAPDVTVFQWWHPAWAACMRALAREARQAGSSVVFVCHNAEPHERFPASRRLTAATLATADRMLALSDQTASMLAHLAPGPSIEVLAHPPYRQFLHPGPPRDDVRRRLGIRGPLVLFFGNVRPYKGLDDLLDAMPALVARIPDATLVIAGRFFEPVRRTLRRIERLGIGARVRVIPRYIPNDEAAALLGAADVVALPYRSASQSGIVPQALALGKVIVATTVGGLPAALGERAILVPPAAPAALASALADAIVAPPPVVAGPGEDWERWRDAVLASARAA